ncbi:TPA: hypothetical protein ACK3JP_000312 [Mannheimia haemolytica]
MPEIKSAALTKIIVSAVEPSEIRWPVEIPLTSLEQKLTAQAMKGLDLGLLVSIVLNLLLSSSKTALLKKNNP